MSLNYLDSGKRALAVGAVAAIGSRLYYGPVGSVSVFGASVPGSVGIGACAAVGSVAADLVHNNVPVSDGLSFAGASAAEYGVAALATSGALDYFGITSGLTMSGAVIGAASLGVGRQVDNYMMGGGYLF